MRVVTCLVLLVGVICVPLLSHGMEWNVTGSTQFLWYEDLLVDDNEQDVAQYVRMNLTKIDKEGKINVHGYGRATKQVSSDEDPLGRLYYLYVEYRDVLKDRLDLRAGRTFVHSAAVSGTVDGACLDFRNLGPVGVTLFGGREVLFDEKQEIGSKRDGLVGLTVSYDTVRHTHLEASFGRKYRDTDVARETVGLDLSTTPYGPVHFYGRMRYDTFAETFNEIQLGAKASPRKDVVLRGEWYQSYPTFDTRSLFSVFAVEQYREGSLGAEYRWNERYRFRAKYAREDFGGGADANRVEIGVTANPVRDLTLNACYEKRNGYAGRLGGVRLHGVYTIARATLQAGIDYDDFRREQSRDDSAKKYWGAVEYEIRKTVRAVLKAENDVNFNYDRSYQGYAAVNITF